MNTIYAGAFIDRLTQESIIVTYFINTNLSLYITSQIYNCYNCYQSTKSLFRRTNSSVISDKYFWYKIGKNHRDFSGCFVFSHIP